MAYDKVVDSAVLDEGLKQIADAIREKAGTTDALAFPQAMADAIAAIQGGGATIEPLTISENGTYTAPDGVDGYSPVTVEVKGSGEELVITDFSYFCYQGSRLDLIEKIDTSKGTDFSYMFKSCSQLTTIPELDTSNGTSFYEMFASCSKLTTIPELDTSNGTSFGGMFKFCSQLTTIPELDTSKATSLGIMFSGCTNLTTVPRLYTPNVESFSQIFNNCSNLTTVSGLDLSKINSTQGVGGMFNGCAKLTNLYLYDIGMSITIGSGTSYGHLLTLDSLVHTIKELCTVTSSQTLTIGSAHLEKIAGLYCRITDDTNEKKTMELCESTDEGAMTLVDYASEKNWLIQ